MQGNRWYESWNRAGLEETSQNPGNPLQLNISPIRNWRALEVFLYLWWQKAAMNPLYEKGIERIGCYVCPSMLESEYEELRVMHPDYAKRWDAVLAEYAKKRGLPDAYAQWGLWRWKALPPKMRELCRDRGIPVRDDYTLQAEPPAGREETVEIAGEKTMEPAMEAQETGKYKVEAIRRDFPILGDIIYLDNAATSFSPEPVIAAMVEFEHRYRANVGRGVHRLTSIASQRYWHAHEKVAEFIGGKNGITVFTKNTTESVNMVALGLGWKPGDRVDHHHSRTSLEPASMAQARPAGRRHRYYWHHPGLLARPCCAGTGDHRFYPACGGHAGIKRARRHDTDTGDREDLPRSRLAPPYRWGTGRPAPAGGRGKTRLRLLLFLGPQDARADRYRGALDEGALHRTVHARWRHG